MQQKQGSRRRQTPPLVGADLPHAWRVTVSRRPSGIAFARPIRRANMTSSTKPKLHNVSQRSQMRTEPRPHVLYYAQKFGNASVCCPSKLSLTYSPAHFKNVGLRLQSTGAAGIYRCGRHRYCFVDYQA